MSKIAGYVPRVASLRACCATCASSAYEERAHLRDLQINDEHMIFAEYTHMMESKFLLISVAVPRFGSSRQGKIASKARNFKRVHSVPKRPSTARPTPVVRDHSGRELPCWAAR
eukprot:COSAG06_NODE_2300_length_7121_cov_19.901453_8_plen_114_part_00